MIRIITALLLISMFYGCKNSVPASPPNVILILADDLGYGELGVYGQEKIKTPNIDGLAKSGMMFSQFYSGSPVCAPARCIILTGKHAGHAHIRGNDEWRERGEVWDYAKACADPRLEGQRPLPEGTISLGSLLQKQGYKTGIFGKWGLGAPDTEGVPNKQGFDSFYGYNCQRQAHNLYPVHLWENDKKVPLDNELIKPHTALDSTQDVDDEDNYNRFLQKDYAPQKIHEKALAFIQENKSNPFFLYYASPLPHLPLQVPQEYVDRYRKQFDEEKPYPGNRGYFPHQYPKSAYAGMITYLDVQVGEMISMLKDLNIYENTIIIFTSDNGPTYTGGVDFDFFESSGPFSNGYGRTKGFVHEGGIRVPLIVHWPGHIEAQSRSDHIAAFYDILPTICELTGTEPPDDIDGLSFVPALTKQKQVDHEYLYWEFPAYKGQQAVRMGKWKGIRKNIFDGNMKVELYDLENDIQELNDISADHPEIVKQVEAIMVKAHTPASIERFKILQLGD